MFGMSVKSVPGCFVAIAPRLIGVPVAGLPLPEPHFRRAPVCAAPLVVPPPPLDLLLEPQPTAARASADASARTTAIERNLRRPGCIVTTPLQGCWGGDRSPYIALNATRQHRYPRASWASIHSCLTPGLVCTRKSERPNG